MGLRDKLKKSARSVLDKLFGEYSAEAPEEITPFERNVAPEDQGEVIRARLKRPRDAGSGN